MKALILVGGFGTRLRPLTLSVPKPIVEFCNKPMLVHQIEALVAAGVSHIILAMSETTDTKGQLGLELDSIRKKLDITITFSFEREPMGTAGPLALARSQLEEENECFFVINSDIIGDFPFTEMITFHKRHGKEGSMIVTTVDDPTKYGVVIYDEETGLIKRFVEKPQTFISNKINAGVYLLNPSVLDRIPCKPASIVMDTFPKMVEEKELYCMQLDGYWMDVGQPKDYLRGMCMHLTSMSKKTPKVLASGDGFEANVLIHPSAKIGADCHIGPDVVIGPNVVINNGCRILRTTLLKSAFVDSYTRLESCIIGWNCKIGKWVRIENTTVMGENAEVMDELHINGGHIWPNMSIADSVTTPMKVMPL